MQIKVKIVSNIQIAKDTYKLSFASKEIAENAKPGQFIHIKVNDNINPLLRRPISICDIEGDIVYIVYRIQGKGTERLASLNINDEIDILGPLGHGVYPVEELAKKHKKVYLIGGGIGSPPLLYAARKLAELNVEVVTILGFADSDQVILEDDFSKYGKTKVYTIDSSYGRKGLVTDNFTERRSDALLACGPRPMLKAIKEHENLKDADGYFSLEEHMACGLGACMSCVTKIYKDNNQIEEVNDDNWEYKKVCDCGPVFPMAKVVL